MGMFDYIRCERVMPDGFDGHGHLFQSKDFGCEMHIYTIEEDGRLMHEDSGSPWCSDPKPWPIRPEPFHGFLRLYTLDGDPNGAEYWWREYNAKFTDGRLVQIDTVISELRGRAHSDNPAALANTRTC